MQQGQGGQAQRGMMTLKRSVSHLRKRSLWTASLLLLSVFVSGCESAQTTAAHKIANVLPRVLGPAKHYTVHVSGNAFAIAHGAIHSVQITGIEVHLAPHVTLDRLRLTVRNVSIDVHTQQIEKAGQCRFLADVGQANLNRYMEASHPDTGAVVTLESSHVAVTLPLHVFHHHAQASLVGTLAPDPSAPTHLDFAASAAHVGALPIPAILANAALDLANPVFDLSQGRIPFAVTHVQIVNRRIVLQGTADLNHLKQLSKS